MIPSDRIQKKISLVAVAIIISLCCLSCTKNNDQDNEPGEPAFELNFTGAINKKSTGTYAVVQFYEDKTVTGVPIFMASIGLSGGQGELFSLLLTQEKGVKPGTYSIDFSLDPYFSSNCIYTEDDGATLYGALDGSFQFTHVSSTHVRGTVNLSLEHNNAVVEVKGHFNAVKP